MSGKEDKTMAETRPDVAEASEDSGHESQSLLDTEPLDVGSGSGSDDFESEDGSDSGGDSESPSASSSSESEEEEEPSCGIPPPAGSAMGSVVSSVFSDDMSIFDPLDKEGEGNDAKSMATCTSVSSVPHVNLEELSSEEVKQIYLELIQSLKEIEEKRTRPERAQGTLRKNINKGNYLARQIRRQLSRGMRTGSEKEKEDDAQRGGVPAADLKLACEHTKMCATTLRKLVESVMMRRNEFHMDDFLTALKGDCLDATGHYSEILAVAKLSGEYYNNFCRVQTPNLLMGAISSEDFAPKVTSPGDPEESVKTKAKASPRKRRRVASEEEDAATQAEIVNDVNADKVDEATEGVAKHVMKKLKTSYKVGGKAPKLLEVAQGDTVHEAVGRLFGASFLVREGRASLNNEGTEPASGPSGVVNLTLKPEKPKNEKKGAKEDRNQFIASFSSKFIKEWMQSGGQFPPTVFPSTGNGEQDD